ncbi:outer membrane protein assembly factor BamD [Flaviflagellibacter deserti]|uniref:Outer membrane protein assembly factor BamD n=1 Tax=Flaviflagellibacter deserti TaxID=2267266 RepID=A0ABV9Z5W3_9HYPH
MMSSISSVFAAGSRGICIVAVALVCVTSLTACSTMAKDDEEITVNDEPADKLYNEGLYNLNNGDTKAALERFKTLDQQHPYTEWARKAHMMEVYANYRAGNYDESSIAAKRYLTLHPGSKDAAYAQFLLGMSYYNQIPDVTRDQQRTQQALQALDEVVRKYPDSEYADGAQKRVQIARDQLAGKEMEIGRFYLQQRNWIGAVNRFKTVVVQYQTTRHVEEALARLAEAYMSLGIVGEAQTAAAVLGHNFPQSDWYKDTYKLVQSKGVEPREDKGSWISKAFKGIVG